MPSCSCRLYIPTSCSFDLILPSSMLSYHVLLLTQKLDFSQNSIPNFCGHTHFETVPHITRIPLCSSCSIFTVTCLRRHKKWIPVSTLGGRPYPNATWHQSLSFRQFLVFVDPLVTVLVELLYQSPAERETCEKALSQTSCLSANMTLWVSISTFHSPVYLLPANSHG